ncbi:hypothetical protein A2U01_0072261, partial [Trifolium medium]|nr:hypothetical protein [Trifolium medium]
MPTVSIQNQEKNVAKDSSIPLQNDTAAKPQEDTFGHKLESSNSCLDPSQPK